MAGIGRHGGKSRGRGASPPPSSASSVERLPASGRRSIVLRELGFDSAVEMKIYLYLPEARSGRPSLTPLSNALLSQSVIFLTSSATVFHTAPPRPYAYFFYLLDRYITLIIYTKFQIVGNGGSWVFDFLKFRKIDFSLILRHNFRKF